MNISRRLYILLIIFCFILALSPFSAFAIDDAPEVKADVSVAAVVPTKACPQYSSIVSNVSEILSDMSQKGTITVKVFDCSNVAISGAIVKLSSNRGAIDRLNKVDSTGTVQASGDGQGLSALTDINGFAFYQVYSNVAGESLYTARVDEQLDIGQVKITYLPLPFPKNISVVVEVPKVIAPEGQITIFKPKNYDIDKEKLVNLTMELRIPSWVFYLTIVVVLINIFMFLTIMLLMMRIRIIQQKEEKILEKEESEIEKLVETEKSNEK